MVAEDAIYYVDFEGSGYAVLRKTAGEPPAVVASLPDPRSIAVDRQGGVYYPDCVSGTPESISITRIAPDGTAAVLGSAEVPSGGSCFAHFLDIVRAPDGTISVGSDYALFQMLAGGALELVGEFDTFAEDLAVGPDGALYRSVHADDGMAIERLLPTGRLVRVAGSGFEGGGGDGGPAIEADLGFIYDLAVGADGALLLVDFGEDLVRLRRVGPDGIIRTIAGGGPESGLPYADGTPATAVDYIQHVDVGPDGWIYTFGHHSYRFPPGSDASSTIRIAADDGGEIYEFSPTGRHLRTLHALTGAARYTFTYDAGGRLTAITDGDGLVTEIQRNGTGAPTAIVAPFGQTTIAHE